MNKTDIKKYIRNLDDSSRAGKEKKQDLVKGILYLLLFFVPLAAMPILLPLHYYRAVLGSVVICWGVLAVIVILSIYNGRKGVECFYKIENAHTRFQRIDIHEAEMIRELYADSALTFPGEPQREFLDFLFNWLNYLQVLKSDKLKMYCFSGHTLKSAYPKCDCEDKVMFCSIFLKDLDLNDSNRYRFSREHFSIGTRWLDDIVDKEWRLIWDC